MKLFIGNLPLDVTEKILNDELLKEFSVENVKILYNRETGKSRGFGFVDVTDQSSADALIRLLDRFTFRDRKLQVSFAKEVDSVSRRSNTKLHTKETETKEVRRKDAKLTYRRNKDDDSDGPWR